MALGDAPLQLGACSFQALRGGLGAAPPRGGDRRLIHSGAGRPILPPAYLVPG
jgi:hypothetical protein